MARKQKDQMERRQAALEEKKKEGRKILNASELSVDEKTSSQGA